jgi:hypothetical protein
MAIMLNPTFGIVNELRGGANSLREFQCGSTGSNTVSIKKFVY